MRGGLRALGLLRALLRPLLGDDAARRGCGHVYAIWTLVLYSFQEQHRRAFLGLLWLFFTPILFLAVYLPVASTIVPPDQSERLGGPYAFSIFVALGFVAWICFVEGVQGGATSLVTNPDLVRHSPIPLWVLPAVKVLAAVVRVVICVAILLGLLTALGRWPGTRLLLFPVALLSLAGFTCGLALITASVAAVFRDLLQVLSTLLLVWFFAAPITYIPEGRLLTLALMNPITPSLTLLRASFLPAYAYTAADVGMALAWAALSLVLGSLVFRRLSWSFADHA